MPDTFADTQAINSAKEAGAKHSATNKTCKYSRLTSTHIFTQWSSKRPEPGTVELVKEIGRWTTSVTGDETETSYLFQQMSVVLQRGNAVAFQKRLLQSLFIFSL